MAITSCQRLFCTSPEARLVFGHVQKFQGVPSHHAPKLVLAGFLFLIGLGFFLAGAWPVIGFLGLELLVVWGAFKLNYRAARHRETIHTTTEELMVESQTPAGKRAQKSFPIGWLRVSLSPSESPVMKSRDQQKVILSSHGEQAEIGKYLHPAEKAGLSRELGAMIDRARATRDAG